MMGLSVFGALPTLRAQTLFSIGNPTAEEQLQLEMINRARANPPAEGQRLDAIDRPAVIAEYGWRPVNRTMMKNEFNAIQARPPLSFNAHLISAARGHSLDMRTAGFQGHTSSAGATWPGASLSTRATNSGYTGWGTLGENVYAYVIDPLHGHAGFQVDWGSGTGGMINGRPHRANIHSASYREVGIGVASGQNGQYGPGYLTQDFGARPAFPTFITGVAYYDLDADGFYDIGEGLGGVEVRVAGASYYAVTTASGGYSVPVDADGNHTVTFTLAGLSDHQENVTVTGGASVKLDYTPSYVPPVLSGPASVAVGTANSYSFQPVAGATGYEIKEASVNPSPPLEGAENGNGGMTIVKNGYAALQGTVKRSGAMAFHLAHASGSSPQQSITFHRVLVPRSAAILRFYSRLRVSDNGQWARVDVSADGGQTWDLVWRQRGNHTVSETSFSQKDVSLAAYEGRHIQLRFSYQPTAGYFFSGTGAAYGWFFDDISLINTDELSDSSPAPLAGGGGEYLYTPGTIATKRLYIRATTAGGALPWSGGTDVQTTANDYANWASRTEAAKGLPVGTLADRGGDHDGDGLIEAYEYGLEAAGLDPTTGVYGGPQATESGGYLTLDYAIDTGRADVSVEPLASSDLVSWYDRDDPSRPAGFEDILLSQGAGTIEHRRARVPSTGGGAFLKLRVVIQEP